MQFLPTKIPGIFIIELEKRVDERGYFARTWCQREFAENGLSTNFVQINSGFSYEQGTLRGLHYQHAPHAEVKLVRCLRGAIYDVGVDMRRESPTFGQWISVELTADDGRMLYLPEGIAHGYQTLCPQAEMSYQTTAFYAPQSATGVRFDDPALGIHWPLPVAAISSQDQSWSLFSSQVIEQQVF